MNATNIKRRMGRGERGAGNGERGRKSENE